MPCQTSTTGCTSDLKINLWALRRRIDLQTVVSSGRYRLCRAALGVRPFPKQLRYFVDALAFGGREQHDLTAACLEFGDGQNFGCLSACELVGLGQNNQELETFLDTRADDIEQDFVEFGEPVAWIAHQYDAHQILTGDQIIGHNLLPTDLVGFWHGSVAVAWQVCQNGIGDALFT